MSRLEAITVQIVAAAVTESGRGLVDWGVLDCQKVVDTAVVLATLIIQKAAEQVDKECK